MYVCVFAKNSQCELVAEYIFLNEQRFKVSVYTQRTWNNIRTYRALHTYDTQVFFFLR